MTLLAHSENRATNATKELGSWDALKFAGIGAGVALGALGITALLGGLAGASLTVTLGVATSAALADAAISGVALGSAALSPLLGLIGGSLQHLR